MLYLVCETEIYTYIENHIIFIKTRPSDKAFEPNQKVEMTKYLFRVIIN